MYSTSRGSGPDCKITQSVNAAPKTTSRRWLSKPPNLNPNHWLNFLKFTFGIKKPPRPDPLFLGVRWSFKLAFWLVISSTLRFLYHVWWVPPQHTSAATMGRPIWYFFIWAPSFATSAAIKGKLACHFFVLLSLAFRYVGCFRGNLEVSYFIFLP